MATAETHTPISSPYCCFFGVAPRRKPVLRSCDVSPAIAAMMQMTEPMAIAPTMPSEPVEPLAFSAMVEMSSVAMAMPETGLFDDQISPTMREETVAKKKPNTSTISAPRKLTGMAGNSHMNTAISRHTASTTFMEMSCSVRRVLSAPLP